MHKILLVDDEPGVLRFMGLALERAGYEVLPASEPLTALQHVRAHTPALMILDMELPGMHGLDLLQVLRGDALRFTPAIAITGHKVEPDEVQAHGFVALLLKPFTAQELLSVVRDNLP